MTEKRNKVVIGWGWMAPRKRPKRLEKKLQRRGYLRVISKHRKPPPGWLRPAVGVDLAHVVRVDGSGVVGPDAARRRKMDEHGVTEHDIVETEVEHPRD